MCQGKYHWEIQAIMLAAPADNKNMGDFFFSIAFKHFQVFCDYILLWHKQLIAYPEQFSIDFLVKLWVF